MTSNLSVHYPFGRCVVCTSPATGCHYGAVTCEACKGFFKRSQAVVGNNQMAWEFFECITSEKCDPETQMRSRCKKCRYTRCVHNGMSIHAIRRGRCPDVIRYGVMRACAERASARNPLRGRLTSSTELDYPLVDVIDPGHGHSWREPSLERTAERTNQRSPSFSSGSQESSWSPGSPRLYSAPSSPRDPAPLTQKKPPVRLLGNPFLKSNVSVIVYCAQPVTLIRSVGQDPHDLLPGVAIDNPVSRQLKQRNPNYTAGFEE